MRKFKWLVGKNAGNIEEHKDWESFWKGLDTSYGDSLEGIVEEIYSDEDKKPFWYIHYDGTIRIACAIGAGNNIPKYLRFVSKFYAEKFLEFMELSMGKQILLAEEEISNNKITYPAYCSVTADALNSRK